MATEKRLIDANALMNKAYWHGKIPTHGCLYPEGSEAVDVDDIEKAPTVEAVEVVRCKDCKHYEDCDHGSGKICYRWDEWIYPNEDDFCSLGERKDNG